MRSNKRAAALAGVLLCAWSTQQRAMPNEGSTSPQPSVSQADIDRGIENLRRDPNMGGEIQTRTLKWVRTAQAARPTDSPQWIIGFFEYVAQWSGVLLWGIGAIAVAAAAVWSYRLLRSRPSRSTPIAEIPAASEKSDLDSNHDSMPDDVAAAALELSRAGQIREALSLLYRGALSRAINPFGAEVDTSMTEREALGAMRARLDATRTQYITELIRMRQRVVYAGDAVAPEAIALLCTRFHDTLDADAEVAS